MYRILILIVLLFALALPVFAQDAPVTPLPEDTSNVISFEQLLQAITNSVAGSLFIASVINGIKVFDPNVNAQAVTTLLSLGLAGAVAVARVAGKVDVLEGLLGWLTVIVPAGVNFFGLLLGSPAVYHAGKALNVPILGYSPPKTLQVADLRHPS